ncbi:MAG: hypothetical protein Q8N44_16950 [Rubrivivax sp.]|nr:hypothetical protein [Rubrivivax sp.]
MSDARSRGFFAARWQGQVGLPRLFWRDMLLVGSMANLGLSFVALMLVAKGVSTAIAVAVHFAPLPYNLFLFAAVWRHPQRTAFIGGAAALWFAAATLL